MYIGKDECILMSLTDAETFLEHHGVKGMKWGVRKDRKADRAAAKAAKKQNKEDDKAYKKASKNSTYFEIYNAGAAVINTKINDFNNQPKYKDKDLNDPKNAKLRDQYMKDFEKLSNDAFSQAASVYPGSSSGNITVEYQGMENGWPSFYVRDRRTES